MKRVKSRFLVLEHAASASELLIALWREGDIMNHQRCERHARMLRELPTRGEGLLSRRTVAVPSGFDTQVDVGFSVAGPGAAIAGWALAFGGLGRECFAFIYRTRATGADAERIVGDRLAVMQTLTLEGIERRLGGGIEREHSGL